MTDKPKILFSSYDEAVQCIGSYENKDIIEVVKRKTNQLRKNLPLIISDRILLQNVFVANYVHACMNKPLTVLDFGGALGGNFYLIDHFLPSIINNWNVIETIAMTTAGNQDTKPKRLHFKLIDHINNKNQKCYDLIFVQGAIHYTPKPLAYLAQLLQLKSPYVYISRQPLVADNSNSFITSQTSPLLAHGPGILTNPNPEWQNRLTHFPITLIPQKKYENLFKSFGYQPRFIFEEEPSYVEHFTNTSINCMVRGYLLERQ